MLLSGYSTCQESMRLLEIKRRIAFVVSVNSSKDTLERGSLAWYSASRLQCL